MTTTLDSGLAAKNAKTVSTVDSVDFVGGNVKSAVSNLKVVRLPIAGGNTRSTINVGNRFPRR